MSKRAKHARCSVIDCTEEHSSLHRPPASEDTRAKWIRFIYRGYAPRIHPSKNLLVCSNHFAADSFSNLGQYNAGLAGKLFLKEGAVPTVRGKAPDEGTVKHPQPELREKWIQFIWRHRGVPAKISEKTRVCSLHFSDNCFENLTQMNMGFAKKLLLKADAVPTLYPGDRAGRSGLVGEVVNSSHTVRHVASQTDPLVRRTGNIHLLTNAQKRFRSTGTQTKVPSKDCGVCTITFPMDSPILFLQPTKVRRKPKRPRLSLNDEEEGPSACS